MSGKELMTAAEAAAHLNVTKRTILKWARSGKIERVKISNKVVLFSAEAVENFLKQKTNQVKFQDGGNQHAVRPASCRQSKKKGVDGKSSGKSWRSLRKEVATWQ